MATSEYNSMDIPLNGEQIRPMCHTLTLSGHCIYNVSLTKHKNKKIGCADVFPTIENPQQLTRT